MLETFLALFFLLQKPKNISEHENPLKNKFEHLSKQSLAGHPKFQNLWQLESPWALAVSQWAQRGAGGTPRSADSTWNWFAVSFLQRLLAVVPSSSQRCPAILPLNRGRGGGCWALTLNSHSLTLSQNSLKLCSRVFIGLLLKIWFQETSLSLSHFFAARKKEQLAGKNIHFGFTKITYFELHVFYFAPSWKV